MKGLSRLMLKVSEEFWLALSNILGNITEENETIGYWNIKGAESVRSVHTALYTIASWHEYSCFYS